MLELLESDIKQCISMRTPTCQSNLSCQCQREFKPLPSKIMEVQTAFDIDLSSYIDLKSKVMEWLDSMSICWVEKIDIQLSHDRTNVHIKLLAEGCINYKKV